ncbi:MAG TPA: hypothetical protein VHN74_10710 [Candidatus Angelobacter sp.]|nr:hypothetical protein [Candidatus Angelobacter sp.]
MVKVVKGFRGFNNQFGRKGKNTEKHAPEFMASLLLTSVICPCC